MSQVPKQRACWLMGLLLQATLVHASNWFTLESDPNMGTLEVDVTTLRWHGESREFKVRILYEQARRSGNGAAYRSVLATLDVNCDNGNSRWRSASFHPDSQAQEAPALVESYANNPSHAPSLISDKTWVTLRRSACITPRSALR